MWQECRHSTNSNYYSGLNNLDFWFQDVLVENGNLHKSKSVSTSSVSEQTLALLGSKSLLASSISELTLA